MLNWDKDVKPWIFVVLVLFMHNAKSAFIKKEGPALLSTLIKVRGAPLGALRGRGAYTEISVISICLFEKRGRRNFRL